MMVWNKTYLILILIAVSAGANDQFKTLQRFIPRTARDTRGSPISRDVPNVKMKFSKVPLALVENPK
jgi:hypothetical protein